ncbi:MAG: tetratricopeptide repeat protein [Candidatus Falkowbacteria bacterium]
MVVYGLALSLIIHDNLDEKKFLNKNFGLGMNSASLDSIKFYRDNNLSGPIFNNYDLGSALIFWLYPFERVFVDNRPEAYSVDFFSQIYKPIQQDDTKWTELSGQYGINVIYFSHTDGTPWAQEFLAARLKDENWPLIYFDDYTVIMVKNNGSNKVLIEKYKIDDGKFVLRLNELLANAGDNEKLHLAGLAGFYGRADLAENVYKAILAKRPGDAKILVGLGFLRAGGGNREAVLESINYFNQALNNGYKLPGVYNQLGLNYWNLTDYNEAKNMWQKALRLDSNNEHAKYYLDQANELIK